MADREPGEERQNAESDGQTGDNAQNSGQELPVHHRERQGRSLPAGRTRGEQLSGADKATENPQLVGAGLPCDGGAEICHSQCEDAPGPRTGCGRPRPAGTAGRRTGCVPELPGGVTFFTIRKNLPA